MELKRYSRQTSLAEVGIEGQKRLQDARVLCVGVGGLGSPISLYLAAAGVGTLGLVDDDQVDLTNLQRQVLFENSDQGTSKVLAAKQKLIRQNPDVCINTFEERLTVSNAESVFQSYDLMIDGSDNFATRFLTHDAAYKKQTPWIYGAVNQFEGQVAFFWGNRGPCYRCLYPEPPKALIQNCAEAGVLGSVVGTIGTLQATLALQYLISQGDLTHPLCPKIGDLTVFDFAGRWNISTVEVPKRADCPTCSIAPAQIVLRDASPVFCETDLRGKILIDVRDAEEWAEGHLDTAVHWPLDRIERGEIPPLSANDTEIIVYCQSGLRSAKAVQLLTAAGIKSVMSLEGGIHKLKRSISNRMFSP